MDVSSLKKLVADIREAGRSTTDIHLMEARIRSAEVKAARIRKILALTKRKKPAKIYLDDPISEEEASEWDDFAERSREELATLKAPYARLSTLDQATMEAIVEGGTDLMGKLKQEEIHMLLYYMHTTGIRSQSLTDLAIKVLATRYGLVWC